MPSHLKKHITFLVLLLTLLFSPLLFVKAELTSITSTIYQTTLQSGTTYENKEVTYATLSKTSNTFEGCILIYSNNPWNDSYNLGHFFKLEKESANINYSFFTYTTTNVTTPGTFEQIEEGARVKKTILDSDEITWIQDTTKDKSYYFCFGFQVELTEEGQTSTSQEANTINCHITDTSNYFTQVVFIPFMVNFDPTLASYAEGDAFQGAGSFNLTTKTTLKDLEFSGFNLQIGETSFKKIFFLRDISTSLKYVVTSTNPNVLDVESLTAILSCQGSENGDYISANQYQFLCNSSGVGNIYISIYIEGTGNIDTVSPVQLIKLHTFKIPFYVQATSATSPTDELIKPLELPFTNGTSAVIKSNESLTLTILDNDLLLSKLIMNFQSNNTSICTIEKVSNTKVVVTGVSKGVATITGLATSPQGEIYTTSISIAVDEDMGQYFYFKEGKSMECLYGVDKSYAFHLENPFNSYDSLSFSLSNNNIGYITGNDGNEVYLIPIGSGSCVLYATLITGDTTYSANIKITFVSPGDTTQEMSQIEFSQGLGTNIYKIGQKKTLSITGLDYLLEFPTSFYTTNASVVSFSQISGNSIEITANSVGQATIICFIAQQNGPSHYATYTINVFEKEPTFSISLKNTQDPTSKPSFTINDIVALGLNSQDYPFSSNTIYTWYLDDLKLTSIYDSNGNPTNYKNSDIIFYKFNQGKHTIKLHVSDATNSFEKDIYRDITINTESSKDIKISLNYSTNINLLLNGTYFTLSALLDDAINPDVTYSWNIENEQVIRFVAITTSASVVIAPQGIGTSELTVYANVGTTNNPKIISARVTILVEEAKTIKITSKEVSYKPGEIAEFEIKFNDKIYQNANYQLNITNVDTSEAIAYEESNGIIYIKDLQKGAMKLKVTYYDLTEEKQYSITNFSLQRFLKDILPYLITITFIVLVVWVILGTRQSADEITLKKLNKTTKIIDQLIQEKETKKKLSLIKKLKNKIRFIRGQLDHAYDDGEEDLKIVIEDINRLLLLLTVVIQQNTVDKINYTKIKTNYYNVLVNKLSTIVTSRVAFESKQKQDKMQDLIKAKKEGKKRNKEIKEYSDLLKEVSNDEQDDN